MTCFFRFSIDEKHISVEILYLSPGITKGIAGDVYNVTLNREKEDTMGTQSENRKQNTHNMFNYSTNKKEKQKKSTSEKRLSYFQMVYR